MNRVAYTQKLIDKLVGIPSIRVGGIYWPDVGVSAQLVCVWAL